jgi:hypothetical protein
MPHAASLPGPAVRLCPSQLSWTTAYRHLTDTGHVPPSGQSKAPGWWARGWWGVATARVVDSAVIPDNG